MRQSIRNRAFFCGTVLLTAFFAAALPACQEVPLDPNNTQQSDSFDSVHPSTGMQGFKGMSGWDATNGQFQPSTPFPGGFKGF